MKEGGDLETLDPHPEKPSFQHVHWDGIGFFIEELAIEF
jgi:hypothetical protein